MDLTFRAYLGRSGRVSSLPLAALLLCWLLVCPFSVSANTSADLEKTDSGILHDALKVAEEVAPYIIRTPGATEVIHLLNNAHTLTCSALIIQTHKLVRNIAIANSPIETVPADKVRAALELRSRVISACSQIMDPETWHQAAFSDLTSEPAEPGPEDPPASQTDICFRQCSGLHNSFSAADNEARFSKESFEGYKSQLENTIALRRNLAGEIEIQREILKQPQPTFTGGNITQEQIEILQRYNDSTNEAKRLLPDLERRIATADDEILRLRHRIQFWSTEYSDDSYEAEWKGRRYEFCKFECKLSGQWRAVSGIKSESTFSARHDRQTNEFVFEYLTPSREAELKYGYTPGTEAFRGIFYGAGRPLEGRMTTRHPLKFQEVCGDAWEDRRIAELFLDELDEGKLIGRLQRGVFAENHRCVPTNLKWEEFEWEKF